MTAGLSSIFLFKVSLKIYGLLGSRSESLFPESFRLKPFYRNIEADKGDAMDNDRASRIMRQLLKENVYYPQIMGKLLTSKKVQSG